MFGHFTTLCMKGLESIIFLHLHLKWEKVVDSKIIRVSKESDIQVFL